MAYPSTFSAFTYPTANDRLNSPSHSALHNTTSSAVGQLETVVGLSTSSAMGSLMYDVRSPDSNGGGHVQTANKGGTGQTSYAKGDLLVATSSSVLAKLAVGANNQVLVADDGQAAGIKWGAGGTPVQRFYSSPSVTGTPSLVAIWYKPSTLSYAIVEVLGGGFNGGNETDSDSTVFAANGGRAGGYARKLVQAASLPLAASVIVGSRGGVGTSTYFGSVISTSIISASVVGTFSVGVGGDVNLQGEDGGTGGDIGGQGGSTLYGTGGYGVGDTDTNGNNGSGFGSGGGGAGNSSTPTGSGGVGAGGLVVITEY